MGAAPGVDDEIASVAEVFRLAAILCLPAVHFAHRWRLGCGRSAGPTSKLVTSQAVVSRVKAAAVSRHFRLRDPGAAPESRWPRARRLRGWQVLKMGLALSEPSLTS